MGAGGYTISLPESYFILSLRVILYVFIFCESAQNRLVFTNTQTSENSKTGRVYEHKHLCPEGSWLPDPSPTALCLCLWLSLSLSHISNGEWTFGTTQSLQLTHKTGIIPSTLTNSHQLKLPGLQVCAIYPVSHSKTAISPVPLPWLQAERGRRPHPRPLSISRWTRVSGAETASRWHCTNPIENCVCMT